MNSDPKDNNNGLITKIWGSPSWESGHAITFGYPINPTDEQKKIYHDYFVLFGKVLPCKYCRDSYQEFILEPDTLLNEDVFKNRETLTKWFWKMHERVNKKLGITYHFTFEDLNNKYESFRARCSPTTPLVSENNTNISNKNVKGCVVPLDYKKVSYKNYYNKDCVIIPLEIAEKYLPMARKMFSNQRVDEFILMIKRFNSDYQKIKLQPIWYQRNRLCNRIIKYMRLNGIQPIDHDGNITKHELMLVMMLCCSCPVQDLI